MKLNFIEQGKIIWQKWREAQQANQLLISAPPCPWCKNWKPEIYYNEKYYDGIILCHANDMFPDFSCFEPNNKR